MIEQGKQLTCFLPKFFQSGTAQNQREKFDVQNEGSLKFIQKS